MIKMSTKCTKDDLFKNLEEIAKNIIYYKKNSCPRVRIHFHYPKIKYVKKLRGIHDMSTTKKLESDWHLFCMLYEDQIMKEEFYKRYSEYVKNLRSDNLFFYRFLSNYIEFCFYKEITLDFIKKITGDFFKILAKTPVTTSLRDFSFGLVPKGNYKISDCLTIKKPQKHDFLFKKIPATNESDFGRTVHETSAIINYRFSQSTLGDN